MPKNEIQIITFGGGTIGDFGGFVASVLKRGVKLVHVPSTWLSAIDSAHGGKTALNVSKLKNQIGTFYPAAEVYLIRSVLIAQEQDRTFEALGEVFKTSLLNKDLWHKLSESKKIGPDLFWSHLPEMIETKMKIVKKDPLEKSGFRHILNLGHTLGHLFESQFKLPHGTAVLFGLAFAIEWSFHKKIMNSKNYYEIRLSNLGSFLPDRFDLKKLILATKNPTRFFYQDKKMTNDKKINFIFLERPGKPILKKVTLNDLMSEMHRHCGDNNGNVCKGIVAAA